MKKLAIMQPYFMPYIGYWQLMNEVDHFIFYDDVNYIKKGYINRNNILINGESKRFNIPLIGASQNRLICNIEIDYTQKWEKKFLNTIYLSYKKADFFEAGFNLLEGIIRNEDKRISELIFSGTKKVAEYLGIETQFTCSSSLDYNTDLRGQEKIVELCTNAEANHYINPIGGMSIYENDLFLKNEIELSFIKTNDISYPQLGNSNFTANLSIIDVIMNNSVLDIKELLRQFQLQSKS